MSKSLLSQILLLSDLELQQQMIQLSESEQIIIINLLEKLKTLPPKKQAENERKATVERSTKETEISISLQLDTGAKTIKVDSGVGFLNHMLNTLARFLQMDLEVRCKGDLYVDDHHTVEDVALALGTAFDKALGQRTGIKRFGSAYAPLDEALARVVVDISSRPSSCVDLKLNREKVGDLSCEMATHFFQSFAVASRLTLHVDVIRGDNDHHKIEASFKALALALKEAISVDKLTENIVPSTKGVLA